MNNIQREKIAELLLDIIKAIAITFFIGKALPNSEVSIINIITAIFSSLVLFVIANRILRRYYYDKHETIR
ncbi:hypothetical protein ACFL56_03230 [Candidatus Margulisiibacteriota bacterium]